MTRSSFGHAGMRRDHDESSVRRIGAVIETPAELAHALRQDAGAWDIVLVGHQGEHVGIGERARLTLEVRGHAPIEMEVVVVWRRLRNGPGLPAALGLQIDPSDSGVLGKLRHIATGQFEDDVSDVLRWRTTTQSRHTPH